ncbi:MAG: hypothetical protein ACQETL_17390 [Bacteroidota bacterium]
MKILVGTLYSGENEFEECKKSLENQTYTDWDHFILKNLPNKEAHDRLYKAFMDKSDEYDLFLKLDADMVFSKDNALQVIVDLFKKEPNLDHAVFKVKDWASGLMIIGQHVFSSRAKWEFNDEQLFVDHSPQIPGQKINFFGSPSPLVIHSPNPSPFQAFHFGVHRALKIVQHQKKKINLFRMLTQWKLLKNIWRQFEKKKDVRRAYILSGADLIIDEGYKREGSTYKDEDIRNIFESDYKNMEPDKIFGNLKKKWNNPIRNLKYIISNINFLSLGASIIIDLPKRVVANCYNWFREDIVYKK